MRNASREEQSVAVAATATGGIQRLDAMPDFGRRFGKAMRLVSGKGRGWERAAAIPSVSCLFMRQKTEVVNAIPATDF